MVELTDEPAKDFQSRDKIDNEVILIQGPFHLGRDAKVMAVQRLAHIALIRHEVRSAEYEIVLRESDMVRFGHEVQAPGV